MPLKRVFVALLICFIFGCGETEEPEPALPEVTIEFLGFKEVDKAEFLLKAKPHTEDLHVLIEFDAEGKEAFHVWRVMTKGSGL